MAFLSSSPLLLSLLSSSPPLFAAAPPCGGRQHLTLCSNRTWHSGRLRELLSRRARGCVVELKR
eukprot:617094-Rhodomonas_salina.1